MERHPPYEMHVGENGVQEPSPPQPPTAVSLTVVLPPDTTTLSTTLHTLGQPVQSYPVGVHSPHTLPMVDGDDLPPPKADFSAPPPYDLATKLPSYEEVQREKSLQGELPLPRSAGHHRAQGLGALPNPATGRLTFLAIDTDTGDTDENGLLGTDFMFFTAFFVAFLFNWIGFLLLMCFCHTVAARYGALSGFGLSLAKWTLIVKHSTDLASHENSWLWWLIMAFGLLICVRAIIQYLNIKRGWRLLSGSAQERLLFFY